MAPMSWSGLPVDLLEIIFSQQKDIVHIYPYRNVCRSWRSVVDKLLASSPPHLFFFKKRNKIVESICLFNVFTGDSSNYEIPVFKTRDGQSFMATSVYSWGWHGWVVIKTNNDAVAHDVCLCLYNPFTKDRIRLPTFKLDHYLYIHNCVLSSVPHNCVLSSVPTNPSSIALAIRRGRDLEKLIFWKSGDEDWTPFVDFADKSMMIVDIISYKGGFCAIDWDLNFIRFELGPVPRAKKIPTRINHSSMRDCYRSDYLVESLSGDLLMVHKVLDSNDSISEFKVYKLDWERMKWDEITSLGDEAIFLAYDESVSIRAGQSTGCRHNCIYFSLQEEYFWVFDMGNQTIDLFPFSCQYGVCYGWFTVKI